MDKDSPFNDERFNFRMFPKDPKKLTAAMVNEFTEQYSNFKKQTVLFQRNATDGIRMNDDSSSGLLYECVICDEKLANLEEVNLHLSSTHHEPVELLRNTAHKPIVGLDLIIEYRDDLNEIKEFECTLCSLFFSTHTIFWHVISSFHKEKFFAYKHPDDFINHIENPKAKAEKIDEALINYHEKNNSDRGYFLYRRFEKGRMESATVNMTKINMTYLYPTESTKVNANIQKDEKWLIPVQKNLNLTILNDQQFQKGKELLQKMNQAILEFTGPIPGPNAGK
ncbi:hypothetical protein TYRP_008308 [Tyrophagus putrescentiae]|nr:hypothetical protein TYRP_008308 [Tyrophagus putrescentiae]